MNQSDKKKTGVYLRTALPCELEILEQEHMVNKYLQSIGETSACCFFDNGFSGCTTNRPALQSLLYEVQQGRIDKVVVSSISRLSRDFTMAQQILRFCMVHSTPVIVLDTDGIAATCCMMEVVL